LRGAVVRPLSILHTESSLGWGGQEIRILSEARGMIERGHEVRVLGAEGSRLVQEAPAWGVPAFGLPIAKKRLIGLKCMLEWMKLERCHVVSTHSSTDAWLVALALFVLRRPCPMVRTRHISAPVSRGALTRWLYTRATARIVTTGEALRQELIDRNGFRADRIISIPTGVDATRFAPGDRARARTVLGLPEGVPLIGIVATLRSWKGHRYLIEAMKHIRPEAQLVIVGDGPQREALEALVDRLGLRARVRFAGNQSDVLPWLQAMDAFALPSYANEGVPQALVQAMMVGLPCVTTHVGSIAEVALHERNAMIVEPKSVRTLASALERLLADSGLGARLGRAAREHCVEGYSFPRMLDAMEKVYREVSGRP
jgi:glycosyltransferase involved in cell wall biosynthesis